MTVLVRGESGVGKSALVRHFVDELRGPGSDAVVLSGRCYERESVPYKALDGVVDALARWLARLPKVDAALLLPARAGLLAEVFPVLRRVEAVAQAPRPPADGDPQQLRRAAVHGAARAAWRGWRRSAPLVRGHRRSAVGRRRLAGAARRDHAPARRRRRCCSSPRRARARTRRRRGRRCWRPRRARCTCRALPPDEARALAAELLSATAGAGRRAVGGGDRRGGGRPSAVHRRAGAPRAGGARRSRGAPAPRGRAVGSRAPARRRRAARARAGRRRRRADRAAGGGARGRRRLRHLRLSTRRRCARPTWCARRGRGRPT